MDKLARDPAFALRLEQKAKGNERLQTLGETFEIDSGDSQGSWAWPGPVDGSNFNFYGVQLGYRLTTSLGDGNYRLIANVSSRDFMDPAGEAKKSLRAFLIPCDQELIEILGMWIRLGAQDQDAAVICETFYSGGLNIGGKLWGREKDQMGIGYGYLKGGNWNVDKTQVVEGYVRLALNEYVALTLDSQYMNDQYLPKEGADVDDWIVGARMTVEF